MAPSSDLLEQRGPLVRGPFCVAPSRWPLLVEWVALSGWPLLGGPFWVAPSEWLLQSGTLQ